MWKLRKLVTKEERVQITCMGFDLISINENGAAICSRVFVSTFILLSIRCS